MARTGYLYTGIILATVAAIGGCSGSDNTSPFVPTQTYQEIGPFSESQTKTLAPVKLNGLWGFIDASGNLAIMPQYRNVLPFTEGLAAFDSTGRWGFINEAGGIAIQPQFNRVQPFSESLAAAKTMSRDKYGFINNTGSYSIQPQFDSVRPFGQGLAPVLKDGKWGYINTSGKVVLSTSHYRAYRFTADGFAVVRPQRNGLYGYISKDGSLKLPAIYEEATDFVKGLAAVKIGGKWGYINTSGSFAIPAAYQYATPFSAGVAAVKKEGSFFYINSAGATAFPGTYEIATPFTGGKALVMSGGTRYYIDSTGTRLWTAQAPQSGSTAKAGDGSCTVGNGVWNNYQGGMVSYRLLNVDTGQWNIGYQTGGEPVLLYPGGPSTLPAYGSTGFSPTQSFIAALPTAADNTNTYFNINLSSTDGKYQVSIANTSQYKAPPTAKTNWFDVIKGLSDIFMAAFELSEGNVFGGLYELTSAAEDLTSGNDGSSSTSNQISTGTGTFYLSQLSATANGNALNPLTGNFCGGDSYTVSDGNSLVVEMTAARSNSTPGEVDVKFFKYNTYFALQATKRLNDFRTVSNGMYLASPYGDFLKTVFANYQDTNDNTLYTCTNNPNSGYLQTLMNQSLISYSDIISFYSFADNFDTMCKLTATASTTGQTWCQYWAQKLTSNCVFEVSPLSISADTQNPQGCFYEMYAKGTLGPITSKDVVISSSTCTQAASSCSFWVNVPVGYNSDFNLSDGVNTTTVHMQCVYNP